MNSEAHQLRIGHVQGVYCGACEFALVLNSGGSMAGLKRDAVHDLPTLRDYVTQAATLARDSNSPINCEESDHFGLMSLTFLSRQIDHAESVLLLVPRRDAVLIARTMLDGLYQILWAYGDPAERGFRWRAFAIEEDRQKSIEEALSEYGSMFLRDKAKNGEQMADPYHWTWHCGKRLRSLAVQVEGASSYDEVYSDMSDWEHWGVGGMGSAISRPEDGLVTFNSSSPDSSAQALAVAFQCLIQTLGVVNAHFHLQKDEAIRDLQNSYMAALGI